MNDDNNGGCLPAVLLLVLGIIIAGMVAGVPNIGAIGLSWDSSAAIARTHARLEMERVRQAQETARVREREQTAREMSKNLIITIQWIAVSAGVVGAIAVAAWATQRSVAAWAARPHRPAAPQITINMTYQQALDLARPHLMALPGARLEWVDEEDVQGWAVVDDRLAILRPLQLTDSQHRG
jgi:hypothetical protein